MLAVLARENKPCIPASMQVAVVILSGLESVGLGSGLFLHPSGRYVFLREKTGYQNT